MKRRVLASIALLLCFCFAFAESREWKCPGCGEKGLTSNFCPDCGTPRPEAWTCPICGRSGLLSKYCPDCGIEKGMDPAIYPVLGQWRVDMEDFLLHHEDWGEDEEEREEMRRIDSIFTFFMDGTGTQVDKTPWSQKEDTWEFDYIVKNGKIYFKDKWDDEYGDEGIARFEINGNEMTLWEISEEDDAEHSPEYMYKLIKINVR